MEEEGRVMFFVRRNCLLDLSEIEKVLMDIKADDVKVIPVPKHCDWADFMVLATGRSTWHVKNHEIGPIAVLGNRYHLNVVSFDIHQNLLDLRQIQKAITAVNGEQRTEPYLLFP
ncbi:hypothetical protein VIGAN_UM012500 [Vigna angularis var. angularis]|uniref:Uncharacterized protein n=1 Tax=Vigna angularis var. angularis TaxID=157739 RepID=A0A0S3TDH4_PHAAN|nr:hypothetical protein VIGAN_UM012500 [Vigna angularis var. angularis]